MTRTPSPETPVSDDETATDKTLFDETYEIGKRDGYEKAVQDIDLLTGGDGEYRYCMGVRDERHCPDAETMKARIAERFHNTGAAIVLKRYRELLLKTKAVALSEPFWATDPELAELLDEINAALKAGA